MKINIDLHILKKILMIQDKLLTEMVNADKHWNTIMQLQGEVRALLEFIQGEIVAAEKNDK